MELERFSKTPAGRLVKTPQGYWAFVPNPVSKDLQYSAEMVNLLSEADAAVSTLEGMGRTLPNPDLLVTPYAHREAVLSSRIEGTQASLSDLFLFEAASLEPAGGSDVREVANYLRAMNHGLKRLKELPLSLRLVREIHAKLLEGVRGQEQTPGEFRERQNWLGSVGCRVDQATYVPPPPSELNDLLKDWESFLHLRDKMPPLIQCALMHSQFETIHPFLDGNGRVGRLLITLFLCERERLSRPLLYLSGFLERHREEYYRRLQLVREAGEWENWVKFFLEAVVHQAKDALDCADRILRLKEAYRDKLQTKKVSGTVLGLLDSLFLNPFVTTAAVRKRFGISFPAAQKALAKLEKFGIVREMTGRKRNRVYVAKDLLRAIENEPAKPK